jgi:hypothetical protein
MQGGSLLLLTNSSNYVFPYSTQPLLKKGVDADFERCESCINLRLVGVEEWLQVINIEV